MDDSKLVDLYLKRDESAITLTASKYGGKLFRLALSIVNDKLSAEECVNDSYLKAWNSIPPNEPRKYLLPYLLRITRQVSLNRLKSIKAKDKSVIRTELTREMEECIPFEHDMTGEIEAEELLNCINGFLAGISAQKRNVFIRRYWFCDPVSEISKRYGMGESRVKTMLYRLRADLKKYLEENGYTV